VHPHVFVIPIEIIRGGTKGLEQNLEVGIGRVQFLPQPVEFGLGGAVTDGEIHRFQDINVFAKKRFSLFPFRQK